MDMDGSSLDLFQRLEEDRCLVIGEVGLAHDGDIAIAHALIDAIADGGADAAKFQTHIAEAESTSREPWRVHFSEKDATRFDYWQRTSFDEEQWKELKAHTEERGLAFLSSPFSVEAVELLLRLGVRAWKIASGEVTDIPLIEAMASSGLPALLSTGLATHDEIATALEILHGGGSEVALLQCTSEYPCPPEKVGLDGLARLRERYGTRVGLSDHSGTIFAGIGAAALGADFVEVHVKSSADMPGPDAGASLAPEDLRMLTAGVRAVSQMRTGARDQDEVAAEASEMRRLFTKSIVASRPIASGEVIEPTDVTVKKPGDGMPPSRLGHVIGKKMRVAVGKDELIRPEDLD